MKNYYDILEVNQKASKEVIQKAYKVLVRKYHPDLYRQDQKKYAENKIKEITKTMMRIIIQDSENKEKKYVYYVVIKTLF